MRLDAAGKACPIPVIMAKKELDNGTQDLSILVDGQTQIDNLSRLGKTYGREIHHLIRRPADGKQPSRI